MGAGCVPGPGAPVPDVELTDQHGQRLHWSELWQGQHALLVFYPFAFSPTCTRELDELAEAVADFDAAGVQVAGVSCDPVPCLRAFSDARGYPVPLLSDFWPHGAVAQQYGVFDEEVGAAVRGSFLLDASGILRWSVVNPRSRARDVADLLAVL